MPVGMESLTPHLHIVSWGRVRPFSVLAGAFPSQTDWIAFAVASALTILGPYMVYVTSARKLNLSDPVVIKKKQ